MSVTITSTPELEIDESTNTNVDVTLPASPDHTDEDYAHQHEQGRRFHAYDWKTYVLPNDSVEQSRLDLQHDLFRLAIDGKLFLAPIPLDASVLDIGCGTGLWAIELAKEHPSTKVLGLDLSPIQHKNVPSNCTFRVQNVETDWTDEEKYDLIHSRAMILALSNWESFLANAYRYLKPGGYIEVHDFAVPSISLRGSTPLTSPSLRFSHQVLEAAHRLGKDAQVAPKLPSLLKAAGFEDVHVHWVSIPIGPWAKGQKNKKLGELASRNFYEGAQATSVMLSRVLGLGEGEVRELVRDVQREFVGPEFPNAMYVKVCFVYARKPIG